MGMIRIRDHVARASTYDDGDVIFRLMLDQLMAGENVNVSFDGITSVPSAFLNASFVRLLERVSFDEMRQKVSIKDSTKSINDLLRRRLEFAAHARGAQH